MDAEKDIYDIAVEKLSNLPYEEFKGRVFDAWHHPEKSIAGCLFQYCTPNGMFEDDCGRDYTMEVGDFTEDELWPLRDLGKLDEEDKLFYAGCLVQIRGGENHLVMDDSHPQGHHMDLTLEIIKDVRIPKWPDTVTKKHLSVFAEWQRRLDKALQRDQAHYLKMLRRRM